MTGAVKPLKKATLPVIVRLQALQAASRLGPGGARVIADAASGGTLPALLREVNETVLGRSLQFECGGNSLSLDVAGRRVLRLTAAEGLTGAETCLAVEALEDEQKDDLIKLLQALARPKQDLRVVSGPITRGGEGMSVGLPVALLADLLLIDLNLPASDQTAVTEPAPDIKHQVDAPAPATVDGTGFLANFAAAMGDGLMAWLVAGGESDGKTFGDDDMVSHLSGFLDDEAEALGHQLDQVSEVPGAPVCLVLGAALVEGANLLVARAEGGLLLGVTAGDATSPVLRAWNRVRG